MLAKVKQALRVKSTTVDDELLALIASGIADIRHAGASFEVTEEKDQGVVVDYVVTDPLVSNAIISYCKFSFGSPADMEKWKRIYDEQKGQMRESRAYGMEEVV